MEDSNRPDTLKPQMANVSQQQALFWQLSDVATRIHHIDELLSWLAQTLVKQFDVHSTQFWAAQANHQGQLSVALRSMACQDSSFPQNFLTHPQIVTAVGYMLQDRPSTISQSVEKIFPQPVAILLKRYRLNCCAYVSFKAKDMLPPPRVDSTQDQVPTPLSMVTLLLAKQFPPPYVLQNLHDILQTALSLAINRGLLLPDGATNPALSVPKPSFTPMELVPHRIEDVASSPLTASGADLDRSLRRIYAAINGERDVVELAKITRYRIEDVLSALRQLAALHRIEIYGRGGQIVDSSLLHDDQV